MTGFADVKLDTSMLQGSMQIKSWNNRYLEVSLQLPNLLNPIERKIRDFIESRIARGKLEFSVRLRAGKNAAPLMIDEVNARAVADSLRRLARIAGIAEPITLSNLLAVEGILCYENVADTDRIWLELEPCLGTCLESFQADRAREGESTRIDLENKLAILDASISTIAAIADTLDGTIKNDLRSRFTELIGDLIDETRIMVEIASYLAKHTINEEIVRFRSHLASFRSAMQEEACGKKLDFICQEFNREANTIGSKSYTSEISGTVIRIKDAIENIREQIRNIE